jgi:hypothetical protein
MAFIKYRQAKFAQFQLLLRELRLSRDGAHFALGVRGNRPHHSQVARVEPDAVAQRFTPQP